ncbi:MAG: ABC transporter ATP-binding protein [bacterium]|nr:ABC transporter ATP-binding protein [bacterium]
MSSPTAGGGPVQDPAQRGAVSLRGVTKRFGDTTAVDQVDLDVRPREFISLLGPSGCGKTTTLRMVSGFERPDEGRVIISGADTTDVPPHRRRVNTVFQSYALFEHMRVAENVAFGLKVKRQDRETISTKVAQALDLVRLGELAERYPAQLSGGQRQRVALARAVVNQPEVLLLDEPLSALDLKLRQAMRHELGRLHTELGMTFIFVTHDQQEAITMSDRIAVMDQGRIHQLGTPTEIYERPASRFVADFIGETNLLDVTLVGTEEGAATVRTPSGEVIGRVQVEGARAGGEFVLAVRPQRVVVVAEVAPEPQDCTLFGGVLVDLLFLGDATRATVRLPDGSELVAVRHNEAGTHPFGMLRPGDRVKVGWLHEAACLLDR